MTLYEESRMWFAGCKAESKSAPKWYRKALTRGQQAVTTTVASLLIVGVAFAAYVTILSERIFGTSGAGPAVVWEGASDTFCTIMAGPGTATASLALDGSPQCELNNGDDTTVARLASRARNNSSSGVCAALQPSPDPNVAGSEFFGPWNGAPALAAGAADGVTVEYTFASMPPSTAFDATFDIEWSFAAGPTCP